MSRGFIETIRGETFHSGEPWSHIAKRNATPADLDAAQREFTGKLVTVRHRHYHCLAVRLDSTRWLIFDLVVVTPQPQEQSHVANEA